MEEIWKEIEGYEGLYQISNLGQVKSLGNDKSKKEKILKLQKNEKGYLWVKLSKNGKGERFKIHRLVMTAFNPIDNMENFQINHIDKNRTNNRLKNLEWCTCKYNIDYSLSIPIVMLELKTNKFIKSFISSMEAGRQTGFNNRHISECCNKKYIRSGNNIYKGYRWVYLEEYINNSDYPVTS